MTRKIIGAVYKTAGHYAFKQVCIAYVASELDNGGTWQAYVCVVLGDNQRIDEQYTCNHGAKLSRSEASGFFPHLPITKYKTE